MGKALGLRACVLVALGVFASQSFAQYLVMSEESGRVEILTDNSTGHAGRIDNWYMGETDHLYQEEYFFRRSSQGAMSTLGTMGLRDVVQNGNIATFKYGSLTDVSVDVTYFFTGGQNTSDIGEQVRVKNNSGQVQHFELIEYDDFDLNGTTGDDTGHRNNANSISQYDANVSLNAEVAVAPAANYTEVAGFPNLLNDITGAGFGNLNTANSDYTGDASFAFQWVFNLNPGQAFIMSKDKLLVVPEPGTLVAFGGLVALALRRRKASR